MQQNLSTGISRGAVLLHLFYETGNGYSKWFYAAGVYMNKKRWEVALMQAAKIAVGSSAAICIAEALHLEYAASAGSIALLTIVATKWETVKLSALRVVTFAMSVILAWVTITQIRSEWLGYGLYVFLVIMISEVMGWKATISVNAVIGTHFLMEKNFTLGFILNEFTLVIIGISLAFVLNLFHNNNTRKKEIVENMRYTERRLQMIMGAVAAYLSNMKMQINVWEDLSELEERLQLFINDAYDYQNNTFQSHPGYYIDYFEMRLNQCHMLHNLHYEMRKIREMPTQANQIAEYLIYLADFVVEKNAPDDQIQKLENIFEAMKQEPLPVTRQEFESRAILYHILMDLEEFLLFKKHFVEGLDEVQRKIYWE